MSFRLPPQFLVIPFASFIKCWDNRHDPHPLVFLFVLLHGNISPDARTAGVPILQQVDWGQIAASLPASCA